ncbi:carbon-nitrogen hydrolase family protein [soil metagenome]
MTTLKAAAIQLNSQPDVEKSLKKAQTLVEKAAGNGAKLICLPENFAFMGDEGEKLNQADKIAKAVEKRLPEWAVTFGVTLLGGGYPVSAGKGKIFNRSVLILPDGSVAATYDKIHLFDVEVSDREKYRESATVQGGKTEAVVYKDEELPAIGFSICYDVRFPELYRKLVERGAEILTVPSAFTRPTGEAHWEVLLRARAIENSAFVIAPAQTGKHGNKRLTWGHSIIIDPWGKVLEDAGTKPGYILADIDLNQLEDIRRKLPSLMHRRL